MKHILKVFCALIITFAGFSRCKDTIIKPTCSNPTKLQLETIQIYPTSDPINTDISKNLVDPNSASIMANIGNPSLHPDFGSGLWNGAPIGIPYSVVCGNQAKVPIVFRANTYDGNYGNESDAGPYPIPQNAPIEGNGIGDSHVLTFDLDNQTIYELYNAGQVQSGWEASSGAIFNAKNSSNSRTEGWTSADASGMAILPILVRYDEMKTGKIDHCIRFTLSKAKVYKGYVAPASHKVSGTGALGSSLPMGARIRVKSSFNVSSYSSDMQVILTAMKSYGLILADIGSDLFISGAPDERWNNTDIQTLKNIKASDFEVVKLGTIK